MQALGANRFVQGVRQHLHCLGHLRHTLAFIQKCLGLLFHFLLQYRGRRRRRGAKQSFPLPSRNRFTYRFTVTFGT